MTTFIISLLFLFYQNNHNDDMAVELANVNAQMHALVGKHAEEVKGLKHKIEELQAVVDAVNQRIEEQVRELCDHEDDNDQNSLSGGSVFNRRDSFCSPYSRHGSFMESPMVERSVSFTLGPRRNLPDFFSAEANNLTPNRGYINSTLTSPSGTAERKISAISDDAADYEDVRAVDIPVPTTSLPAPVLSTLSPVKSALKVTPRVERSASFMRPQGESKQQHFSEEESSPQFLRLYAAMQLLTTSMRHGIEEERILRSFTTEQHFRSMEKSHSDQAVIQELQDRQEHLEEKASSQQDTLDFCKELERTAGERMAAVEFEFQQMKAQYLQSVRNEQVALGNAAKFEQMYLDALVQLDKVRKEKKHYMDASRDFNEKCAELQVKVDDAQEAFSVLESQYQLAQQEVGVLRVERDELMKRFFRNGVYPSAPTPRSTATVAATGTKLSLSDTITDGTSASYAAMTPNGHSSGPERNLARSFSQSSQFGNTFSAPFTPSSTHRTSQNFNGSSMNNASFFSPGLNRTASEAQLPPPAPTPHVPYIPPEPQPGTYSTLSPHGKKLSEAYISLFGEAPQSANF